MKERNIIEIENNPSLEGMALVIPDVVFSTPVEGHPLKMQVIMPWPGSEKSKKRPTIVFVQGSGWKFPDVYYELPQLAWYAKELGYVIATVTHRNCLDGFPFPAYLQDVKTAIRFLRAHADQFGVDTDRIGIWGTSSGGNTALLIGGTGDDLRYRTWEWDHYSDKVKAVVECFGPTDMEDLFEESRYNPADDQPGGWYYELLGGPVRERSEVMREMSPIHHVRNDGTYPPTLLLHGDADPLVPYRQAEIMLDKLLENDVEASLVRIRGGVHEHSFWSREVHQIIADFWRKHL